MLRGVKFYYENTVVLGMYSMGERYSGKGRKSRVENLVMSGRRGRGEQEGERRETEKIEVRMRSWELVERHTAQADGAKGGRMGVESRCSQVVV